MPTYTKQYADMEFDRLKQRALRSLNAIIEDAKLAQKQFELGGLPNMTRNISQAAETVVEAVAVLWVLMEIRKLDGTGPKEVKLDDVVEAIKAEHLDEPQNDEDRAYDAAIDDVLKAVEELGK
jgi:hypothetical protein